jgi:hypothetical protein
MGRLRIFSLTAVLACTGAAVLVVSGMTATEQAQPGRPLLTGFLDPPSFGGADRERALARAARAGATFVRVLVTWPAVAPDGATKPKGFNARDPGNRLYRWAALDAEIRAAVAKGFSPLVYFQGAPAWAQNGERQREYDGPARPSPAAVADFAHALATRYSGTYRKLPRVRYWQVWNEPNLNTQLVPQATDGKLLSPVIYRAMVNAAARAVHGVHRDNLVIAGGLAPFGGDNNDPSGGHVESRERIRPLEFMRAMLCVKPACNGKSELDVWSHHPYTYGGPTHSAFHPDDVSMGDLGEMRRLIASAQAAGHIRSRQKVGFWVTEFSYDSQPGDPNGLPPALHARWVSESLYRMWSNGVSHVIWFLIRDEEFPQGMFQSGLYLRGEGGMASDEPKPALQAFRFPFVAFTRPGNKVFVWGRTPSGNRKSVIVEEQVGDTWRELTRFRSDRSGIFSRLVSSDESSGFLRARVAGGEASVPFSLTVTPDFRFCPWGSFC